MPIEKEAEKIFHQMEEIFDDAVILDRQEEPDLKEVGDLLDRAQKAPVMELHYIYYNGGWYGIGEVKKILKEKPHGVFATVLMIIRDKRVAAGDYSLEALNKMYGLAS